MSSSTITGWLNAKKTPQEVARAKNKAMAEKRQRNSRKPPSSRGGAAKKGPKRRSKKKSSYEEDSDFEGEDEEVVDDFIVDDDDEVEIHDSEDDDFDSNLEDEDEEEDEEEIVLHDDEDSEDGNDRDDAEVIKPVAASSRSSRAAGRQKTNRLPVHTTTKNSNLDDFDDDSDSDDDESFLPKGNTLRPSAPSKLLQLNAKAAKNRYNPSLEASMTYATDKKKMNHKRKKPAAESSLMRLQAPVLKKSKATKSDPYEDDEELTSPSYTPNKPPRKGNPKPELQYEEVFSSEEENTINYSSTTHSKKPRGSAGVEKSRYFDGKPPKAQKTIVLDDSDSSDDEQPPQKSQFHNHNHKTSSSALEDTPDANHQKRRKLKKLNKFSAFAHPKASNRVTYSIDDSSDEDEVKLVDNDNDGGFDEDMRVAMKMSLMESKKKQPQRWNDSISNKKKPKDSNNSSIEVILEDSSDEEDGDQGDEYYDEEKETASNVLRSAEQLSGHVVRAMSGWFHNDDENHKGGAVQGIIVDGAIALGNIDESKSDKGDDKLSRNGNGNSDTSNNSTHQWISKSEMAKAIPNVTLSGYQLIGVNWMALLNGMTCEVGTKGTKNVNGVLADEMGLGKTVQTIAFLAWLKYRRQTKVVDLESPDDDQSPTLPHLIVVPVSTLPNWIREFEKFCPEMSVVKYHGNQQEREALKEDLREHLPKYQDKHIMKRTKLDVIVAPVSYFSKENSPDRKFLSNFKYDYLVVDEAHNLKNAKSTRYKMLDKVKTEHRLLLTGTPVQNNPQELLNMLSFIMPLFSKAGSPFEETDNYSEQMLKHFVDETADHGDEQTAYKKLKQLFAPFVLRRRKADVIAQLLPKKERKTIFVELSQSTRAIYKSIIQSHFNKNGNTINPGTGEHLFTNLRKCAHHPLLLRNRWNTPAEKDQLIDRFHRFGAFKGDGCTKDRIAEEMQSWNDFEIHLTALDLIQENEHRREELKDYVLDKKDLFCSSKFESLRDLLPGLISDGHRILVFSSWTSCLDLLGCLMEHLGIQFQRMDGSCPSDERQRLIDRFNTDRSYSVFLLSTKACGLGINLTSADTCILHDLDFNPFNDLQAEDRCHRIGQKKPVTVYKLIASDTVDEDIYKMQEKKAKMNAAIMDSSSSRKEKSAILKSVLDRAEQEKENTTSHNDDDEIVI